MSSPFANETASSQEEVRLDAYRQAIDYFALGANVCGFAFSAEAQLHMQDAFELMARVDSVIDHGSPEETAAISGCIGIFNNSQETVDTSSILDEKLVSLAHTVKSRLTHEQSQRFGETGQEIINLSEEARETNGIMRYIKLARKVGELSGSMLLEVLPLEDTEQSTYPVFKEYVRRVSAAGIYADWAMDLKADYEEGLTQVKPTLINRGLLATNAVPDVLKAVISLGPNGIKLAGLALRMARRVVRSALHLSYDFDKS